MDNKGQMVAKMSDNREIGHIDFERIVLEKGIFSNIFEKDIRRVYIYKKSERIAKALHLIAPAFKDSKALRDRIQRVSIEIVDASILPPAEARDALSRELLTLSSVLSMAKTAGMLSPMNADIIMREAHALLAEIAGYEEPRVSLPEIPTMSALAKSVPATAAETLRTPRREPSERPHVPNTKSKDFKGQNGSFKDKGGRKEAILSILSSRGPSYIKDISTLIREVSEKTIQRELQALVSDGKVIQTGKRRWTTYSIVGGDHKDEVIGHIDQTAVAG